MNALFLSLIPLIAFAIIDSYAGLNIALIATIALTLLEVLYTLVTIGKLDGVSLFSIALVGLLVGLSYLKKNRIIFKLKPAILNASMGAYMLILHALKTLTIGYYPKIPANGPLRNPSTPQYTSRSNNAKKIVIYFGYRIDYSWSSCWILRNQTYKFLVGNPQCPWPYYRHDFC